MEEFYFTKRRTIQCGFFTDDLILWESRENQLVYLEMGTRVCLYIDIDICSVRILDLDMPTPDIGVAAEVVGGSVWNDEIGFAFAY